MIERLSRQAGAAAICAMAIVLMPEKLFASPVLITEDEAKLPLPKGALGNDRRGITRGPRVEFVSDGNPSQSPIHFRLRFQSFGGATIDPSSVRVTYIKDPAVDLTARLKAFVQPNGIELAEVQLPVGEHLIRVDLKDSDGRTGSTSFVLKIAP